ncbi:hypothetical protein ACWATR_38010 [Nostoc sp. UIC 10890]
MALTYPLGIAYLAICPDWGIWLISETRQKCVSIIIGLLFVNEFCKAIALLPGWRSLLRYHYLSVIKKL